MSVDNKARYCALHDCSVVVGGTVPECAGRSARWNKVAWLRRSYFMYQWLVWMDLDAIFARPDASLADILDPAYDLHVTHDFGIYETHDVERRHRGSSVSVGPEKEPLGWAYEGGKINTGFFALKTSSPWSFIFLEQVWAHNDFGMGKSDQASINHVISLMSPEEKKKHIKVRSCTQSRAGKSRLIYLFFSCRPQHVLRVLLRSRQKLFGVIREIPLLIFGLLRRRNMRPRLRRAFAFASCPRLYRAILLFL